MSDSQSIPQLAQRALDHSGRTISAIVWEIGAAPGDASGGVVEASRALGGNWFFFPSKLSIETLSRWRELLVEPDAVVIGIDSDELIAQRAGVLQKRLAALGRATCEAVMLQDAETDSLKAGQPFHRLSQLRDAGLTRFAFLEAASAEVAEWMVENTPARAVSIPFDLADQTAKFRLIETAKEMQTNLLSRRAEARKIEVDAPDEDDLSFRLAEGQVAAVIEPLVKSVDGLHRVVRAISSPMPEDRREKYWQQFRSQVSPPPKPKRRHPPEYGS